MKAIRIHRYGEPGVMQLETVPIPELHPGELLVRVVVAGINPLDWKLRSGSLAGAMPRALPYTPGLDAAGVVVAMSGDVRGFELEDEVCLYSASGGTYAEYVVVAANQVARMPPGVSFIEAAALPTPAQAAWTALVDDAALQPGQRVLIHAAAGAVGSLAVQLAKQLGAEVIAAASGSGLSRLEGLGADRVLDYEREFFGATVRGVDVVLDTLGGPVQEASWATLRPGGILLATAVPPPPGRDLAAGVRSHFVQTRPRGEVLAALLRRKLVLPVARTLTLQDAVLAHQLGEQGQAGGKMVLLMPARDADLFA